MENYRTLKKPAISSNNVDSMVGDCVTELLNAATSFHKLHLKVSGPGSYASHIALNTLYESLPNHADTLAESYQGASMKLLSYKEKTPKSLNSVQEGISYLNEITSMVTGLQEKIPYSEIVNDLDTLKSTINTARYKLTFLK